MQKLPYAAYHTTRLREVRPLGWIRTYLERQCSGLTGHAAASGYPYGIKFWGATGDETRAAYAAWWPYEQTAYWLDGAIKTGYLADCPDVYQQALDEIQFAVDHAAPDGYIGPESLREKDRWPHAVFFRAVLAQAEITGDERYITALVRHYQSTPHPMDNPRDVTGVEILLLLYQATGQEDLLAAAEDLYERFNQAFPTHDCSLETLLSELTATEHGVTFNEIAKLAAMLYSATGKEKYLAAVRNGYAKLERDQLLADGMHSCSEHLRGKDPLDSHETCDVTDHTWALSYLFQATGEVPYADRIEKILFNAAPGGITKDFKALQYFSCPNQVVAASNSNHNLFMRGFNWMAFRPDHEVQCCPGNLHRTMPNYVSRMWMRAADHTPSGAIIAVLYGPGELRTTAGPEDTPVTITSETRYPFEQGVTLVVQPERRTRFTLALRLPAWCRDPGLSVNGEPVDEAMEPGSFVRLEREWQPGDRVRLNLPFALSLEHWPGGGVSLDYGPLVLSLPVEARVEIDLENTTEYQRRLFRGSHYQPTAYNPPEDFAGYEMYPASPWNYALTVSEENLDEVAQIEWKDQSGYPLDPTNPPLTVRVPARRVRDWEVLQATSVLQFSHWMEEDQWHRGERDFAGSFLLTPPLPEPENLAARLSEEEVWIELVPYGTTLLRLTVFPSAA